jgi:hypothetical protein
MLLRGLLWVRLWEVKKLWVRIMGVTLVSSYFLYVHWRDSDLGLWLFGYSIFFIAHIVTILYHILLSSCPFFLLLSGVTGMQVAVLYSATFKALVVFDWCYSWMNNFIGDLLRLGLEISRGSRCVTSLQRWTFIFSGRGNERLDTLFTPRPPVTRQEYSCVHSSLFYDPGYPQYQINQVDGPLFRPAYHVVDEEDLGKNEKDVVLWPLIAGFIYDGNYRPSAFCCI